MLFGWNLGHLATNNNLPFLMIANVFLIFRFFPLEKPVWFNSVAKFSPTKLNQTEFLTNKEINSYIFTEGALDFSPSSPTKRNLLLILEISHQPVGEKCHTIYPGEKGSARSHPELRGARSQSPRLTLMATPLTVVANFKTWGGHRNSMCTNY